MTETDAMPASERVYRWPAETKELPSGASLLIAAVDTPNTSKRESARQRVRIALGDLLPRYLDCLPSAICFNARAGQAMSLAPPFQHIGLSLSHEPGCSLLAINLAGPVGIDLLQTSHQPPWQQEIPALAKDYLGPGAATEIGATPLAEQAQRFAMLWTQHEARLKCLGLALTEWTPALAQRLAACQTRTLHLPPPYHGALAVLEAAARNNPDRI